MRKHIDEAIETVRFVYSWAALTWVIGRPHSLRVFAERVLLALRLK